MKCFLDIVAGYNKPIYRIILTHWYIDHTIGACMINSIKYIEEKKAKYIICGHGELEETEKLIEHNKKRIAQLMKEID